MLPTRLIGALVWHSQVQDSAQQEDVHQLGGQPDCIDADP